MADYEFQIGANLAGLANVETLLGVPPHPTEFRSGAVHYMAGDGQTYCDGFPQAIWYFTYLSPTAWAVLVAWFGGAESISRTIRTKSLGDSYVNHNCIMHLPLLGEDVERGVGGYFDIALRFTHLTTAS